jgi:hypothetical protein
MIIIDNDLKIRVQYEWQQIKKTGYQNNKVYIKEIIPKGMGVFAKEDIKAGDIVEMCHTFVANIPSKFIQDQNMSEYFLPGAINNETYPAFAFGFGCIYNSSETIENHNVDWAVIPESRLSFFIANKDIKRDEELLAWFGEGFYMSRCKPNNDNYYRMIYNKKIDEKLNSIKLPNSKNSILEDKITKMLSIDITEDNKCNILLEVIDLNNTEANEYVKQNCLNKLKQIDGVGEIVIDFWRNK